MIESSRLVSKWTLRWDCFVSYTYDYEVNFECSPGFWLFFYLMRPSCGSPGNVLFINFVQCDIYNAQALDPYGFCINTEFLTVVKALGFYQQTHMLVFAGVKWVTNVTTKISLCHLFWQMYDAHRLCNMCVREMMLCNEAEDMCSGCSVTEESHTLHRSSTSLCAAMQARTTYWKLLLLSVSASPLRSAGVETQRSKVIQRVHQTPREAMCRQLASVSHNIWS